ncbi:MAG: hypothetical protein WDM85_05935 [Caulobacteraceae bacterium]
MPVSRWPAPWPPAASFTTSSTTITLGATAPAWLLVLGTNGSGVNVYDLTNGSRSARCPPSPGRP